MKLTRQQIVRRFQPAIRISTAVAAALSLIFASACYGAEPAKDGGDADPYPLSRELQVLARDLNSAEYKEVLETMIHTDLEAEWQRVAAPDNHVRFARDHGGMEKVSADPQLKKAYDRRRMIAVGFLGMIRQACQKRSLKLPYDEIRLIELMSAAREPGKDAQTTSDVPIRLVMPAVGAEREWPRFRGPTGQGTTFETTMPLDWSAEKNILWKVPLSGTGGSSPIIWGDRIFVTSASPDGQERILGCYARSNGKRLWQRTSTPSPGDVEKLYWKNSYASSTPVTDGQRVIALFGNCGLVCYDLDGKPLWQTDLGRFITMHGPGTSPLLYKDRVIVIQYQHTGETLFAAYNKRTGAELWKKQRENAMCWSTPVVVRVGERDELLYNGSNRIVGYDPLTGEELWRASGSTREAVPTLVIGGGRIYSASGRNGPMIALRPGGNGDVTASHILWKTQRGAAHVPSPLYHDEKLFMVNDTGIASCLDAASGKTLWQERLRGRFSMSPVEASGRWLATNEQGVSYVLQASDAFQLLAENDLGEEVLATPAVLGGRIYFRTAKHLLCVGAAEPAARPAP